MQLSKNFTLEEFTFSESAQRKGIDLTITPGSTIHKNVKLLTHNLLQPLREALGPVIITSGYRNEELNTLIGGSPTSQHLQGEAADIVLPAYTPLYVCRWIEESGLPFDQLIHEFGRWTHVSLSSSNVQRRETLTAYYDKTQAKTVYLPGIQQISA